MLTIEEIDEALERAMGVPTSKRTDAWHAVVDGLLDQRAAR
jgi:hypothetical protein